MQPFFVLQSRFVSYMLRLFGTLFFIYPHIGVTRLSEQVQIKEAHNEQVV